MKSNGYSIGKCHSVLTLSFSCRTKNLSAAIGAGAHGKLPKNSGLLGADFWLSIFFKSFDFMSESSEVNLWRCLARDLACFGSFPI